MRLLFAILMAVASAAAQQLAVGFVSPNVRDQMTYAQAQASLRSFEETNFIAVGDRVLCSLAPRATIDPVIGEVNEKGKLGLEGAENSAVLRAPISFEEMRYAVALLGRYAHQEYVIAFAPRKMNPPSAAAKMATLHIPKTTPRAVTERVLDDSAVLHRTLVDDHTVVVFLPPGTPEAHAQTAATHLRAVMNVQSGIGEIIGDDDRLKAAAIYDGIISEFESTHPERRLAHKLWSAEWHDAVTRTCTNPVASRQ